MKSEGGNGPAELAATSPDGEGAKSHGAGQTPADEVLVSLCVRQGAFFMAMLTVSVLGRLCFPANCLLILQEAHSTSGFQ